MLDHPVLIALAGGLLALSLACGGSLGPAVEPHWTQVDIRTVPVAQGWTVEDCTRDRYGNTVAISCYLERAHLSANIYVTTAGDTGFMPPGPDRDARLEGETLLEVVVSDGDASKALLAAFGG